MMAQRAIAIGLVTGSAAQMLLPPYNTSWEPGPAVAISEHLNHPKICDPSVNQTSGYINASPETPYFFWLFESRSNPTSDPLILWLSGGPGASSIWALLFEMGPCKVNPDASSTTINPYSWNSNANVLWVDQPAGVGYSGGSDTHTTVDVARNMFTFLQRFFAKFPHYQETKFFIFGESYAGHYIPAIAHRLWQGNNAGEGLKIPLSGVAIGNGLTDTEEQFKWYAEMGHSGGQPQGGHAPAVLSDRTYETMKAATPACIRGIKACNANMPIFANTAICVAASTTCQGMAYGPFELTGVNHYDMRIKGGYETGFISTYLKREDVKADLGAEGDYLEYNPAVVLDFIAHGDFVKNYHKLLPDLLHDGIEVLVYNGDCDYICNWLGSKAWTKVLSWQHSAAFNAASDKPWQLEQAEVGKLTSAHGLHFLQIYNAGHMVPLDQPSVSLEMVNAFITGNLNRNVVV